jgi:hypothetical protein
MRASINVSLSVVSTLPVRPFFRVWFMVLKGPPPRSVRDEFYKTEQNLSRRATGVKSWTGFSYLGYRKISDSYEHGNEPLGCIKREFPYCLNNYQLREGLSP